MAGGNWSLLVTVVTGQTITASERNDEFENVVANANQDGIYSASENLGNMQAQTNPAPAGSPVLATSGRGEIQGLRYMIAALSGKTYWYTAPDTTLATLYTNSLNAGSWAYRRPRMIWVSGTAVGIETGLDGTSGDVVVVFPDGSVRTTNNATYTQIATGRVASLSGGSKQSGLRTGSIATNTWYAMYAVKSQDTSDVIAVIDTVFPTQANFATLNLNFGTNSWRYLGPVRVGDNGSTGTGILQFVQSGSTIVFQNAITGFNSQAGSGVLLATSASALSLTYDSNANLPATLSTAMYTVFTTSGIEQGLALTDKAGATYYAEGVVFGAQPYAAVAILPVSVGVQGLMSAVAEKMDVCLTGVIDSVLDGGSNGLL